MKKQIDLSIIIVNYNTRDLLKNCLDSIIKSELNNFLIEVIIVDNASSDDSPKMIKQQYGNFVLIENSDNLGFAKANNLAIRKVGGRYILLLNPDTQIESDTLFKMIQYLDTHPKVGVATCTVNLVNGKIDDASHRGFPTPWNSFTHFSGLEKIFPNTLLFNGCHLGYKNLQSIHEIDSCVGAFMLIRKEAGEQLNWLDEDYFWYGEDIDFCFRAKQKGWEIMYVPITSIVHWKGASSGIREEGATVSTASSETKRKAAIASIEAMKIFYQKHYRKIYPGFINALVFWGINILLSRRLRKI